MVQTLRSPSSSPPAMQLTKVCKSYGRTQALDDVSMTIHVGEIHGLVGRNGAGKSTLVRILAGMEVPDAGAVDFFEPGMPPSRIAEKRQRLVACVYQRPTVFLNLSVAENIYVNRYPYIRRHAIPWSQMRRMAQEVLEEWEVEINPDKLISELPFEQRQIVQIARALDSGSRVILLDEPTVQIEAAAADRLFTKITDLSSKGVTFIFVSHFLSEITTVCSSATVLRDGRHLWTRPTREISQNDLLDAIMLGNGKRQDYVARSTIGATSTELIPNAAAKPRLELASLTDTHSAFSDISLLVQPGELVAIAGLSGSGKNQLGEAIVGLRKMSSGRVLVDGKELPLNSVTAALRLGIAYVPVDRHAAGFIPELDVAENITLSATGRFSKYGFFSQRSRINLAKKLIDEVSLVPDSPHTRVMDLSGGNQQKVVFARALATNPRVLILLAPTAGVDVAAKENIYALMRTALYEGIAIVLISEEIEEILISDRVLVMRQGKIIADLKSPTEEEVVRAMEGMERP